MSGDARAWAKAQPIEDRNAKQVLAHLGDYADAAGEAWAAIGVLSYEISVSARRVQEGLAWLKGRYIEETGRTHLYEGKLYPLYRLKLEEGPKNTREAMRMMRDGLGVRPAAPQDEATGATGRTPSDEADATGRTPTGATGRIQIDQGNTNILASLGASAREPDLKGFEDLEAAYPKAGLGFSDRSAGWDAYQQLVLDGIDAAELVRAAERYRLDPIHRKRDFGPVALQKWLTEGRWRGWRDDAPTSLVDGWSGPADIAAAIAEVMGPNWPAVILKGASWRDEGRTVVCASAHRAKRLLEDMAERFAAMDVQVEGAT